jgi:hypothetical protein
MKAYLDFVRKQNCLIGHCCEGDVVGHHLRSSINSGIGMKPNDTYCIPLCAKHHGLLHQHGQKTFQETHTIDLYKARCKCLESFILGKNE